MGAAAAAPSLSGDNSSFFALAPNPIPIVPEPTALTMAAFGGALLLARLRRRTA
jgi:hypothetical protein